MPNRSDIRDYVREQTYMESDDLEDDKANVLINEALRQVAVKFRWPWLATSEALSVVSGTQSYSEPTLHAWTLSIVRDDKAEHLVEVSPHEILNVSGGDIPSGTPSAYYWHGDTIYLNRVPDANIEYTWLYFQTPNTLDNDTDVPPFDSQFHLLLGQFVISQVWQREEDYPKAKVAMEAFDDGIEMMARFYMDRGKDRPIIVGVPRGEQVNRFPQMPWLAV